MDASANLWIDTKEDTVSALYRPKIRQDTGHRLQRASGSVRNSAATVQLLLIVSKDGSSVAALFTHV